MIAFLICWMLGPAYAKEIQLQKDEVIGQIRRPQVDWVDAKARAAQLVPKLYATKIKNFESEILAKSQSTTAGRDDKP